MGVSLNQPGILLAALWVTAGVAQAQSPAGDAPTVEAWFSDPACAIWSLVAMGVTLAASIVWSRVLGRRMARRTEDLQTQLRQRIAAEEAHRQSESRFRNLFENSPDAIFVESLDGEVLDVNPAGCALHGKRRDQLIGMNVLDLVPAEQREQVAADFPKVVAGELVQFEGFSLIGDQTAVPVEVHVNHIEFNGQRSLLLHVRDIRERKRAEEERARLEANLHQAQKLEALGTLASGVAHDFSNIVTAINGYADLAMRNLPAGHPAGESISMIRQAAKQADGVTRSLVNFAHKSPAPTTKTDLSALARESANMLRHLLPTNTPIQVEEDGPAWVRADGSRIQQVIMNLVLNARDAMPSGGVVRLTVRREGEEAALCVADTGLGMCEETRAHLFEPFFTTKLCGRGTGLGMVVVHRIVTDHQGRIEVDTAPECGTRITIFLPTCEAPVEHEPARRRMSCVDKPRTVLLAEDNEFVRRIIAASMRDAGFEVLEATDGEQALLSAARSDVDIHAVVLDLDLPRLPGEACVKTIRAARPEAPIVIISGNLDRMRDTPAEDEHTRVLAKPFRMQELVDLVAESLGERLV